MEITLCNERTEGAFVAIYACLEEDRLRVCGCDSGESVEMFWGDWDYEYGCNFDAGHTEKLFRTICRDGEERPDALLRCFRGPNAFFDLKRFCAAHEIEFQEWYWI